MQKTTWLYFRTPSIQPWRSTGLSILVVLFLHGCGSAVMAPVDSRAGNSGIKRQAGNSQSDAGSASLDGSRAYHVVAKGDTLYSIAWRYGRDYRDIARWNNIANNYVIYPGQIIRLKPVQGRVKSLRQGRIINSKNKQRSKSNRTRSATKPGGNIRSKQHAGPADRIIWRWPTKGKLVKLNTPTSIKGVDIAGRVGQKVNAAAAGSVVYSGSGLLGYGKLIIIKHNDTFLSAYAHNEKLYAKEGDKVKAGQQIATMGMGNKGGPILHFEIRKDGAPVNPLNHLPKNHS